MRRYCTLWPVAGASATVGLPTPPLPATKCSRRSSMAPSMLGGAPEDERDVRAAEAEGVGERGVHLHAPRLVRHVVEVAGGIRLVEVDGGRNDAVSERQHRVGR